ncbi:MAG: pyrophosphatase [Gammaproteobacteria bacterium]|jgi:NAD+ diphosphatase|nr:pyrophosphatase [Gammaproteobacteria bacterium]MCE3239295.1 pyrophosphatase [Gammaproteobacteria bacterium]
MKKYYILLSQNNILLIQRNGNWQLPAEKDISSVNYNEHFQFEGINNEQYIAGKLENFVDNKKQKLFELRQAHAYLGEMLFQLVGRSRQLLDWRINHKFCGRCGVHTEFYDQNRAKKCPACGLVDYPKISPCILVAITRGDEILLAQHVIQSRKGIYTILAGFVEPGEDLESCIRREVREEVGIEIKNVRYIASQAWPFPNLLMLGFMAEYDSGEISIDTNELIEAKWFNKKQLPSILPLPMTLSYQLINKFSNSAG